MIVNGSRLVILEESIEKFFRLLHNGIHDLYVLHVFLVSELATTE